MKYKINNVIRDIKNCSKYSTLMYLYDDNKVNVVEIINELIERGIINDIDCKIAQMYIACRDGDIEALKALINQGIDINTVSDDYNHDTALKYACKNNKMDIVKLLLDNGAKPDVRNSERTTALMEAVLNRNMDMVKLLLDNDADLYGFEYVEDPVINTANLRTPLTCAAENGDLEMIKLLFKHDAESAKMYSIDDGFDDDDIAAAIATAYMNGHKEICHFLIDYNKT